MNEYREVEVMDPKDVEIIQPEGKDEAPLDVSGSATGSGNGVAVNAAGAKVTVGVGELNNAKGTNAQISNVTGDINFGNVTPPKASRFDKLPSAPAAKALDDAEFTR